MSDITVDIRFFDHVGPCIGELRETGELREQPSKQQQPSKAALWRCVMSMVKVRWPACIHRTPTAHPTACPGSVAWMAKSPSWCLTLSGCSAQSPTPGIRKTGAKIALGWECSVTPEWSWDKVKNHPIKGKKRRVFITRLFYFTFVNFLKLFNFNELETFLYIPICWSKGIWTLWTLTG